MRPWTNKLMKMQLLGYNIEIQKIDRDGWWNLTDKEIIGRTVGQRNHLINTFVDLMCEYRFILSPRFAKILVEELVKSSESSAKMQIEVKHGRI